MVKKFDSRTIKRFAFLPTLLDDGNKVWLEFYSVLQEFSFRKGVAHPRLSKNNWVDIETSKIKANGTVK